MTFADLLPGNGADCSFESVLGKSSVYSGELEPKLVIVVVRSPLADYLALLFN